MATSLLARLTTETPTSSLIWPSSASRLSSASVTSSPAIVLRTTSWFTSVNWARRSLSLPTDVAMSASASLRIVSTVCDALASVEATDLAAVDGRLGEVAVARLVGLRLQRGDEVGEPPGRRGAIGGIADRVAEAGQPVEKRVLAGGGRARGEQPVEDRQIGGSGDGDDADRAVGIGRRLRDLAAAAWVVGARRCWSRKPRAGARSSRATTGPC